MREIKFRAWDTYFKSMVEEKDYHVTLDGKVFFNNKGQLIEQTQKLKLMEFTGLKDKNGTDIYEGDIIKVPDDYDTWGMNAGDIREVIFAYGGFRLKPKFNPKARGNWLEDDNQFEVIGNIHDNPELIEE